MGIECSRLPADRFQMIIEAHGARAQRGWVGVKGGREAIQSVRRQAFIFQTVEMNSGQQFTQERNWLISMFQHRLLVHSSMD